MAFTFGKSSNSTSSTSAKYDSSTRNLQTGVSGVGNINLGDHARARFRGLSGTDVSQIIRSFGKSGLGDTSFISTPVAGAGATEKAAAAAPTNYKPWIAGGVVVVGLVVAMLVWKGKL